MIYINIAVFIGGTSFYFDFLKRKKGKTFFYILAWIILVLLAGLRYKVGGDTYNYMYEFGNSPNLANIFSPLTNNYSIQRQPGWYFIVGVSKFLGNSFTSLQIILALLVNTTFFWFIKKNTRYYFTGIFIYYLFFYCYFNFEILRESLSICAFMLAFKSLLDRKYKTYYLFVILAIFFHISAILLIFLPFLYRMATKLQIRYPERQLVFRVSVVAILIFVSGFLLNPIIQKLLPDFIVNGVLQSKVIQYNEYNFTFYGIVSSLFYYLLIPLFFIYGLRRKYNMREFLPAMLMYVFIGASITFYSIFFRFLNYFTPVYIIIITEYLLYIYHKNRNYSLNIGTVFFTFIFIFFVFTNRYLARVKEVPSVRWYSHWYPYHSVFDKIEDPNRKKLAEYQLYFR